MSDRAERIRVNEAALKARLEALRVFSEGVAARLCELEMPETYLEAARGARALDQADRLLLRMPGLDLDFNGPLPGADGSVEGYDCPDPETGYQAVEPARLRLRACADRLMAAAGMIPEAETYLEALRAARYGHAAERMLRQLYTLPDGGFGPYRDDEEDDWDEWDEDEDGETGVPYGPRLPLLGDADFRHPDNRFCIALPGEDDLIDWVVFSATAHEHVNAGKARDSGLWPDGTPYDPNDPYYSCPRLRYFAQTHPPPE